MKLAGLWRRGEEGRLKRSLFVATGALATTGLLSSCGLMGGEAAPDTDGSAPPRGASGDGWDGETFRTDEDGNRVIVLSPGGGTGKPGGTDTGETAPRGGEGPQPRRDWDGRTPAPGTTSLARSSPVDAPTRSVEGARSAEQLGRVIDQFAVGHNPRYARTASDTFCNIFVWDVTRALGAEIPHWVSNDARRAPRPAGAPGAWEMDANATYDWLSERGGSHGWSRVDDAEAQSLANRGQPVVAVWKNPGGTGHIGVVRPGERTSEGPAFAQAGAENFNRGHVEEGFGHLDVTYFAHA